MIAAVGAGLAGRPPVLPKNGRTQSLLAAAHKAQTATFGTATPLSLGQQAHDKPYQVCMTCLLLLAD